MCAKRRSSNSGPSRSDDLIDANLTARGQQFTFPLHRRSLNLAPDLQLTYYWIDQRLLSETAQNHSTNLCRRIVDHWEQVQFEENPPGTHSPSEGLVLAHLYRVWSHRKRMHQVFRDASLRPTRRGPNAHNELLRADLPDEVLAQINTAVDQRDNGAIRVLCASIFGWLPSSPEELQVLTPLYDQWIDRAVSLYRADPETGLDQFIDEFSRAEKRARRSGRTSPISRRFFDLLMFESKVCFYECYAVLWQRLIPWLAENCNLDSVSEQFLRLWHNQNQSCRPTQTSGNAASFETDVFFGHILSLHPLSGILMTSPDLWELASRYFRIASPPSEHSTPTAAPPEYWDLVRAILLAGKIYRLNDERRTSTRNLNTDTPQSTPPHGGAPNALTDEENQNSVARVAVLAQLTCRQCQSELTDFHSSQFDGSDQFTLAGHCATCNADSEKIVDPSAMRRLLPPPESD